MRKCFLSDFWWHWLARSAMDDMFLHRYLTFFHPCNTKGDVLSCPGALFGIMPVDGLLSSLLTPHDSFVWGKMLRFKYNSHSNSNMPPRQWHQRYLVEQWSHFCGKEQPGLSFTFTEEGLERFGKAWRWINNDWICISVISI